MPGQVEAFGRADADKRKYLFKKWKAMVVRDEERIVQLENRINTASQTGAKLLSKDLTKARMSLRHYRYVIRKCERMLPDKWSVDCLSGSEDEQLPSVMESIEELPIIDVLDDVDSTATNVEVRLDNGTTSYRSLDPVGALVPYQSIPRYAGPVFGRVLLDAKIYHDVDPHEYYLLPLKDGFFLKLIDRRIRVFTRPKNRGMLRFENVGVDILVLPPVGCYFSIGYFDSVYCFEARLLP